MSKIEVVFAIDVGNSSRLTKEEIKTETTANCIRLSVLKILNYLSTISDTLNGASDTDNKLLLWGFKFYNSISGSSTLDRCDFREFNKLSFEEFESRLDSKYESEKVKRSQSVYLNNSTPRKLKRKRDRQIEYKDQGQICREAIEQILFEFQWTRRDDSPVKRCSRRNRNVDLVNIQNQYVFIMSSCPHTSEEMRYFLDLPESEFNYGQKEVTYGILPPTVQELVSKARLPIYWIDVGINYHEQESKEDSEIVRNLGYIQDMLLLTGGSLIPASTLLPSVPNTAHEEKGDFRNRLWCEPILSSSVCDFYLKQSTEKKFTLHALHGQRAYLQFSGNVNIPIHLHSIKSPMNRKSSIPLMDKNQTGIKGKTTMDTLNKYSENHIQTKLPSRFDNLGQASIKAKGFVEFAVHGCLLDGNLSHGCLQSDEVFLVTSVDHGTIKFQHIMNFLLRRRLCIVLLCTSKCDRTITGILKPTSVSSATITIVEADQVLGNETSSPRKCDSSLMCAFVRDTLPTLLESKCYLNKTAGREVTATPEVTPTLFLPSVLENWYHPSLNIEQLSFNNVSSTLQQRQKKLIKDLQRHYRDMKSRRFTDRMDQTSRSPNKPRKSPKKRMQKTSSDVSPVKGTLRRLRSHTPLKIKGKSRSFSAPMNRRCSYIMKQSINKGSKVDHSLPESPSKRKQQKMPLSNQFIPATDFEDEKSLVGHLRQSYDSCLVEFGSTLTCAQTMVQVALHYIKTKGTENPEEYCKSLFREHLILSSATLKDKLGNIDDENSKLLEYQLQITLLMELAGLQLMEQEECHLEAVCEQVVALLRPMAFLKDTSYLTTYLSDVLLENYVTIHPRLLYLIYEELLQPLPYQLDNLFSPDNSSGTQSVMIPSNTSTGSVNSIFSVESMPSIRSTRSSRSSLPSLASMNRAPQRQISIPRKENQNKLRKVKSEKRITRSSTKKIAIEKTEKDSKSEVRRVRRNLFDVSDLAVPPVQSASCVKLERRQSLAVMENLKFEPTSVKRRVNKLSQIKLGRTPKAHHIMKTKRVTETPHHKQGSRTIWHRQEKILRRNQTVPEVMVVEESPEKPLTGTNRLANTPSKESLSHPRKGISRHSSFYAAEENVQPVTEKFTLLEARMSGRRLLSPTGPRKRLAMCKSPSRRIETTQIFSQLKSPSPTKPVSHLRPETIRRKLVILQDSPAKHTRSQTNELHMPSHDYSSENFSELPSLKSCTPRKSSERLLHMTPNKSSPSHEIFTPSKATQGRLQTPVKSSLLSPKAKAQLAFTPKKVQINLSPIKPVSLGKPINKISGAASKSPLKIRRSFDDHTLKSSQDDFSSNQSLACDCSEPEFTPEKQCYAKQLDYTPKSKYANLKDDSPFKTISPVVQMKLNKVATRRRISDPIHWESPGETTAENSKSYDENSSFHLNDGVSVNSMTPVNRTKHSKIKISPVLDDWPRIKQRFYSGKSLSKARTKSNSKRKIDETDFDSELTVSKRQYTDYGHGCVDTTRDDISGDSAAGTDSAEDIQPNSPIFEQSLSFGLDSSDECNFDTLDSKLPQFIDKRTPSGMIDSLAEQSPASAKTHASPSDRKYSPVVSAKSLAQLISSPFVLHKKDSSRSNNDKMMPSRRSSRRSLYR